MNKQSVNVWDASSLNIGAHFVRHEGNRVVISTVRSQADVVKALKARFKGVLQGVAAPRDYMGRKVADLNISLSETAKIQVFQTVSPDHCMVVFQK